MLFEPDEGELLRIAGDAGFQAQVEKRERVLLITLTGQAQRSMFFDAADKRQAARLAAARTFASGATGAVFNTPFAVEAGDDFALLVRMATEVRWDTARKYPQGPTESSILSLFQQLVQDLSTGMVGLCGRKTAAAAAVQPK